MPKTKTAPPTRWSAVVPSRSDQFQLKRTALIREAGKAFGRRGFHNTSLDEVAQVLGVTKPALYYYVKTKEEILYECHRLALDLGDQALARAYEEESSPGGRLRRFLEHYIEALASDIGEFAVIGEPFSSLTEEYRAIVVGRRDAFDRTFRELVQAAIEEGTIAPCDPKLVVTFFMAVPHTLSRWYSPDGPLSPTEVGQAFARFVFEGIGRHEPETASASSGTASSGAGAASSPAAGTGAVTRTEAKAATTAATATTVAAKPRTRSAATRRKAVDGTGKAGKAAKTAPKAADGPAKKAARKK
ncbi:MAG: TetR/AcrR family transcriptional regulator [Burkholderiaceae bacterium]